MGNIIFVEFYPLLAVHMSGFVKEKMVHLSYVRISCMVAILYGCAIRYDISIVE